MRMGLPPARLAVAVLAAWVGSPSAVKGCIEIGSPNPAAVVLNALAVDPTATSVASALESCGASAAQRGDCVPRVGSVLLTYSKFGEAERQLVLDALAEAAASSSALVRSEAREFRACVESGAGCDRCATSPLPSTERWGVRGDEPPPTRADRGAVGDFVYWGRLELYLETLVPADSKARFDTALRATAARTCEDLLEGQASAVCNELGVFELKFACMRLAMRQLESRPGQAPVIGAVRSLDEPTYARVREFLWAASGCCGCGAGQFEFLLSRWRERPPNDVEAWRDIETFWRPHNPPVLALNPAAPRPPPSH